MKTSSPEEMYERIPLEFLTALGKVFHEGTRYDPKDAFDDTENWRSAIYATSPEAFKFVIKRFRNAVKHLFLWVQEFRGLSVPTGEAHLAKVAWFCLIAMIILAERAKLYEKEEL